ncbi:MAG TPA: S-adenosylmethionine decarboxylase [Herbaspirillum sp.]
MTIVMTVPMIANTSYLRNASGNTNGNTNGITGTPQILPAIQAASQPRMLRFREPALQLKAVWRDCRHAAEGLRNADTLKNICLRICTELRLSVMGNAFFQFEPSGVAGTILMNGSHLAIHTWPDHRLLKADIQLSNGATRGDALVLLEQLESCFQPAYSSIDRHIDRDGRFAKIRRSSTAAPALSNVQFN